jgi:Flp pilus assembly protein TadD
MNLNQAMQEARRHHGAGRLREAEALYRQILTADPNHAEAMQLLGLLALQCGQPMPAIDLMEKSIALRGDLFYFHNNLGEAYKRVGRSADAARAFERSLELRPGDAETMHARAVALERAGRMDEAIAGLREAIARAPEFHKAFMSLGAMLEHQASYDQAMELFEKAVALRPDYAKARAARAGLWLRWGDYEKGWDEYEWRWKVEKFPGRQPTKGVPLWDGSALGGRRILLYAEQGLGDTIQFIRYAPMVAERAGRVIVECPESLARLVSNVEGVSQVVTEDARPAHDVQLPLMSLPRVMGTRIETIPANVPYVTVQSEVNLRQGFKVGLCWAGGQSQPHRSIPIELVEMLVEGSIGAHFFSLQKDAVALPAGVEDAMSDVRDFADTARVIAGLDLIISIDTAVAHLGGAMGKTTWTLLARHADWRWLLDREDSPWYPTMRLSRQERLGDWEGVIERVRRELVREREQRVTGT